MSDSEDDVSLIIKNFNEKTTRLISEWVQSSGTSSQLVKSKSFRKFVRHLNPLAPIPSVSDIEQKYESQGTSVSCIVCQCGDPVDGVTLSLDHAAIILIATLMGTSNPSSEIARRLQSDSLRMCHSHIPEVFKKLFRSLKIETTKKLRHVKMGVLEEWRGMFLEAKKIHSDDKEDDFDAVKLVSILQKFINHYYENEVPNPRPLPSTMRQFNVEESDEEEEDEEYVDEKEVDDQLEPPRPKRIASDYLDDLKPRRDREQMEPTTSAFLEPKEEFPEVPNGSYTRCDDEPWPTASSYLSSERYKRVIRDAAPPPQRREREIRRRYSPL